MLTILHGHTIDQLRTLPDGGAQVCVTSPPYWGLRSYGTPPQIWGGKPGCKHIWGEQGKRHRGGPQGKGGQREGRDVSAQNAVCDVQTGQFCTRRGCDAWLGHLGLEPTPDLFVLNMVRVFREVYRVLRADGTLWLNLGDTYHTGAGKGISPGGGEQGDRFTGKYQYFASAKGRQRNPAVGRTWTAMGPTCQPNRMPQPGLKPKDLIGIPWRVAFALQADGWYLREDIVWSKPNPMPESVKDRCTRSHEYIFHFSKAQDYYHDAGAIAERASEDSHARYARGRSRNHKYSDGGPQGQTIARTFEHMATGGEASWFPDANQAAPVSESERPAGVHPKSAPAGSGIKANDSFCAAIKDTVEFRNKRSVWPVEEDEFAQFLKWKADQIAGGLKTDVWTVGTARFAEAHFATFPPELIRPCILAGAPAGGVVIDPFGGSGTTGKVALEAGRQAILIDLNQEYVGMMHSRCSVTPPLPL